MLRHLAKRAAEGHRAHHGYRLRPGAFVPNPKGTPSDVVAVHALGDASVAARF